MNSTGILNTFAVRSTLSVVLLLRQLVAGFPLWRGGLCPVLCHVGFVMDTVALGQVPVSVVLFPLPILTLHHPLLTAGRTIGKIMADGITKFSFTSPPRNNRIQIHKFITVP
jgi:hypothetical protein